MHETTRRERDQTSVLRAKNAFLHVSCDTAKFCLLAQIDSTAHFLI